MDSKFPVEIWVNNIASLGGFQLNYLSDARKIAADHSQYNAKKSALIWDDNSKFVIEGYMNRRRVLEWEVKDYTTAKEIVSILVREEVEHEEVH
jgi:hypothetical protein